MALDGSSCLSSNLALHAFKSLVDLLVAPVEREQWCVHHSVSCPRIILYALSLQYWKGLEWSSPLNEQEDKRSFAPSSIHNPKHLGKEEDDLSLILWQPLEAQAKPGARLLCGHAVRERPFTQKDPTGDGAG